MTLSKGVAESFGVVSRFLAHYYPAKREGDRTFETPYIIYVYSRVENPVAVMQPFNLYHKGKMT